MDNTTTKSHEKLEWEQYMNDPHVLEKEEGFSQELRAIRTAIGIETENMTIEEEMAYWKSKEKSYE